MGNLSFRVNVSIDPETGSPRAAYMQIRVGFAETTRELIPGKAFADYSETGDLLGIEFLAPCASIEVLDKLSPSEPQARVAIPPGFRPIRYGALMSVAEDDLFDSKAVLAVVPVPAIYESHDS